MNTPYNAPPLIPLNPDTPIDDEPSVNARDLHEFLEVESRFTDWVIRCITDYAFVENQDFVVILNSEYNSKGGPKPKDYYLTLDTAKELAMVERTPKGREARQYFIACERRLRRGLQGMPQGEPDVDLLQRYNQTLERLVALQGEAHYYKALYEAAPRKARPLTDADITTIHAM